MFVCVREREREKERERELERERKREREGERGGKGSAPVSKRRMHAMHLYVFVETQSDARSFRIILAPKQRTQATLRAYLNRGTSGCAAASERRGNNLKGLQDSYLARIWP